jgi:hypothetical protein
MEHLGKFSVASMADSTLITRFSMLKLELSNSFGSRVACELARASSLTERAKLVARLVKKLIEPSQVEPSYERVEPAHEFPAHGPTLVIADVELFDPANISEVFVAIVSLICYSLRPKI